MSDVAQNAIRHVVIVGGGSAGWMSAAALTSLFPSRSVQVTLVESEQIGTIGVGEATIPDVINFNAMLGIDEADFLRATNGTFKLGIEFVNWSRIGEAYFHPFGPHGVDMNGLDFHQYWLKYRETNPDSVIEDFSLSACAAKQFKFVHPHKDQRSVLSQLRYAYHFDATAYARYLKLYSEQRGAKRIEGRIVEIKRNEETGFVSSVALENGDEIAGDLFIDCSGFRALLLEQSLGVGFEDWSHWLPCDTAQTIACERVGDLWPFTRSTAKHAGWQWRIPTQHRTGNGHIYSSGMMSDEVAVASLLKDIDGPAIGSPRKIRFKTGRRVKFWEKNCVAIGLSAGFLEPLESTSLFLIQEGISKLISLFPSRTMPEPVRQEYNRQIAKKFDQVRDFIILHYKATTRDDSEFWNYCRTMHIPESLKQRMELFREAGRVFRYEDELFAKPSWVAVMLGQNIYPRIIDPIVNDADANEISRSLMSMATAMHNAAESMPVHEAYLLKYARATKSVAGT